jgi:hypothetical protein
MPVTLEINEHIYNALQQSFGEAVLKEKFNEILLDAMTNRLERFSLEILRFEEKYGVSFKEFDEMWENGKIQVRHDHDIEADYIDWEMMEMEKKELIAALRQLKHVEEAIEQ